MDPLQKVLEEVQAEEIWVVEDIREVEELHTDMIADKEAFQAEAAEVQAVLEAVDPVVLEAVVQCIDINTDVIENIDIEKVVKIVLKEIDIVEDLTVIIVEMMEKVWDDLELVLEDSMAKIPKENIKLDSAECLSMKIVAKMVIHASLLMVKMN